MKLLPIILLAICANGIRCNFTNGLERELEDQRMNILAGLITLNLKHNGWNTILCHGYLPDNFYTKIKHILYTFVVLNLNDASENDKEDPIQYHSNIILISCLDFGDYEQSLLKVTESSYWHPLANIIVYYHKKEGNDVIAKIFYSLWYYNAINAIIMQYDDLQDAVFLFKYSPYVTENIKVGHQYGCWTASKIGVPVRSFEDGFICVKTCHNVSLHSKLRANNLGTCIGFNTNVVSYKPIKDLRSLNLFEDKSKNFHGFIFRAYVTEVEPFFIIDIHKNGTYTLHSRDGMIWNTMMEIMNFGMDLSLSEKVMKLPFNFERHINHLFAFSQRKLDFFLIPVYLFDIGIVKVDYSFPYKESGVCIMSSRSGFETTIFNVKSLETNYEFIIQFIASFNCIWVTFSIFKFVELGSINLDQIGKDLMNAFRNVLLINLHKPPKRDSFRIFLGISLWCFFVISFTSQATIISFLTAVKRGKEVETFEDIIGKGYSLEGLASPDLILPETEERFRIINSRLVAEQDIYGCVHRMNNDTHRFCLMDCSVGRYVERNRLNDKGEQFLHIAKDRFHSHYLCYILHKNSPISDRFNKYLMIISEAGLIRKWEQYRYTDIKDEVVTKPLRMEDLYNVFELYCFSVGFTCVIFLFELIIYYGKRVITMCLTYRRG